VPSQWRAQGEGLQLDQHCALLGQARRWPLPDDSPARLVWLQGGVLATRLLCLEQLHVAFDLPAVPSDSEAVDPLAELRSRWPQTERLDDIGWPGLDGRPVVLHILHDWGGGIERFARDLSEADQDRVYLGLRARGRWRSRHYGEALELCLLPSGLPVRRWPLLPAIGSITSRHAGYRQILAEIQSEFAVASVLVSSLIGHSLDVFDSGLPTIVVGHDYFPLWPELHCNFGDEQQRFDAASREQTVLAKTQDAVFAERDPGFWQQIYEDYVRRLQADSVQMVVPTDSVRHNLLRMAPTLAQQSIQTVGHGLRPWTEAGPDWQPNFDDEHLRLLVLGRIDGGKGLELLRGALPELSRHADLHLLGCGKAGEALFGMSGVHIELDYPHAELPRRLARIRPHAALLLSTVAESFSYTLSELWSLGVVPIATRTGAFAERIDDGADGLLFSPDARALITTVRALANDRGNLRRMHEALGERPLRDTRMMAADYAPLLSAPARQRQLDWSRLADASAFERVQLLSRSRQLQQQLDESRQRLTTQQQELDKRADWGFSLDRQLQDRTRWARSLEQQLAESRAQLGHAEELTRSQIAELESALDQSELRRRQLRDRARQRLREERRLVRSLVEQMADIAEEVRRTVTDQNRREQEFMQQLQQLQASRADLTGQLVRSEASRHELLGSSSWRLTAPLRMIARSIRQLTPGLAFRLRRVRSLLHRADGSLRSRGLSGTVRRALQELRHTPRPLPALVAPEPSERFEAFAVPASETPEVSIIIPVYGKLAYTVTCLRSLVETDQGLPIEIIVVDDCSPDDSADALARFGGLRLLRNQTNLGFIGACNAGAAMARGRYLCFLNNDTAVQAGWLQSLVDTFEQFPDCGLAGAKLIYPDGRLQEAGGIIFSDGAGWNYGRFEDPNDPRFDYPREADYCSGAAILIPTTLFDELGGFDSHYAPAYYEDTDLAFKVREHGLRVYFQPASRVVHYEGISSGTDTSSGIKRYQVVNHEKFLERWRDALQRQPAHDGERVGLACEHRVAGRILVIDATTPTPDQDSGSVRLMNLFRLLIGEHWKVVFFADNLAEVTGYSDAVRALGVEVQAHPWLQDPVAFLRERGEQFDAVLVCRHYIAVNYLPLVRQYCPRARFIFDTVDLHYLREERAAAVADDAAMRKQAAITRRQELQLIQDSDVTVVVSPVERELLGGLLPQSRVDILSNIHQIAGRRAGFEERSDIFFVGGFQHVPNVDAVSWFVDEVWPLVHAELPQMRFRVVGSKMPESIRRLADRPGVVIEGFAEQLEPFLDGCRLAVAPLRYGAGVKGKVNSSMAHGQPVVMTSVAAEGMFLEHGVHGLIADEPTALAAEIVRLYQDPELWLQISDAGLQNVADNFSMEAAQRSLRSILND
ncbi:MAG: glycosyltransferase, partial [Xanthomonadales bacterium]|nr:glycosyltransferase [Xanthomonadales bacterium]